MTPLPARVDFEAAEQAAVMAGGLSDSSEAWGTLLANAQTVLSARTDTPHSQSRDSYNFHHWRDLIAAARILDLAATEGGLGDLENRKTAAVLAACAFGMSGASASASAVIKGHLLLEADLTPGELTALALSSPALGREVFSTLPEWSKHRACIESVVDFLATGNDERLNAAASTLEEAARVEPSAWEGYLLRISRLSLAHAGRLSVARVLRQEESRFPRGYLDRLVSDSPMLLPSQYEAIVEHGVLAPADSNLLIAMPAGTGKTLLGEIALLSSLGREPGLVGYVAPHATLGRQAAENISRRTPAEVRIHRLVGGYKDPDPLDPENRPEVVVATPERFDTMLRLRPELLSKIRCVVFDEGHTIDNGQNGIGLEGMITRLRLAAARHEQVPRFILLSAVLSNADALAAWLSIDPENVIRGTWPPSAKRLMK